MARSKEKLHSFKTLPAFQLEVLAETVASHHELRHQRRFGLRSVECRIVGVVGAQAPISLRRLCQELRLDKGHGSRLVAKLVQEGLIERLDDPADRRSFYLMLTSAGTARHAQIYDDAAERNREWIGGLPEAMRPLFMECVAQLILHSQAMLLQEQAKGSKSPADRPKHAAQESSALVLIEREKLEHLHAQLGALLGKAPDQAV